MRLRPGVSREEAERKMAQMFAEVMPWLTVDALDDYKDEDEYLDELEGTLLSLLFRPRLIRGGADDHGP
jgi:hypothetical protein